jgi:hypothetical protein
MKQVTVPLPREISTNSPRQYVAYLHDPAIADLTPGQTGQNIVVVCDEKTLSWATGDWVLRVSRSTLLGAWVGKGTFGDYEFITFVLAFGSKEMSGPAMIKGELASAAWFRELATTLDPLIPGGVQWKLG